MYPLLCVSWWIGACDGMTYEEIEEQFPEEFVRREKDKLAYRYPRGRLMNEHITFCQ